MGGIWEAADDFGAQLRRARVDRGMTQEQVAYLADMSPANVGKIERGAANPTLSTMARLADAIGTDLAELLHDVPSAHRHTDAPGA